MFKLDSIFSAKHQGLAVSGSYAIQYLVWIQGVKSGRIMNFLAINNVCRLTSIKVLSKLIKFPHSVLKRTNDVCVSTLQYLVLIIRGRISKVGKLNNSETCIMQIMQNIPENYKKLTTIYTAKYFSIYLNI